MITNPPRIVYTARTRTVGGRDCGLARSSDGRLDVKLSLPNSARIGTNPEQLLAIGWSACFSSSIELVAHKRKIPLREVAIDAEVDLRQAGGEYCISARFGVSLPGLDRDVAKSLIEEAERLCAYSKATRGNIDVVFSLT